MNEKWLNYSLNFLEEYLTGLGAATNEALAKA